MPVSTTPSRDLDGVGATDVDTTPARSGRRLRPGFVQRWSRLVHVYSSMAVLLLVLFFGVTGLTLNHPEWTFGLHPTTSTTSGGIPTIARVDGKLDLLAMSQYVRAHDHVHGDVSDFGLNATQGYISYRAPGYAADVTIDVATNSYKLSVQDQGLIGILDDLHRGRATSDAWGWVIDVCAGILVITALAGLSLQLVLRKRRTSALVVAALGGAVGAWIAFTTLR